MSRTVSMKSYFPPPSVSISFGGVGAGSYRRVALSHPVNSGFEGEIQKEVEMGTPMVKMGLPFSWSEG
jgi:hypothetical protein